LLAEVRQRGPRAVDAAEQVGLDHLPIHLGRRLLEARKEPYAGIVHPHVDPAEVLDGAPRQLLDSPFVCHVSRHGQRPPSPGLALGGNLE
jgi:hypothetical protein